MILYDEMNLEKPIKIYNNYASYPKISKYSKSYFSKKAFVYKGKSRFIKFIFTGHTGWVMSCDTTDNNITTTSWDGTLGLWDASRSSPVNLMSGNNC